MSPGRLREAVVTAKTDTVQAMLRGIATLPLASEETFVADDRMVAAGESYLRRALEALLDLGRHLLAKGFGVPAIEYKAIPAQLRENGVLDAEAAATLTRMAGYRNRLVHFYDEVRPAELHTILTDHLGDVEVTLAALVAWVEEHPERLDGSL